MMQTKIAKTVSCYVCGKSFKAWVDPNMPKMMLELEICFDCYNPDEGDDY